MKNLLKSIGSLRHNLAKRFQITRKKPAESAVQAAPKQAGPNRNLLSFRPVGFRHPRAWQLALVRAAFGRKTPAKLAGYENHIKLSRRSLKMLRRASGLTRTHKVVAWYEAQQARASAGLV